MLFGPCERQTHLLAEQVKNFLAVQSAEVAHSWHCPLTQRGVAPPQGAQDAPQPESSFGQVMHIWPLQIFPFKHWDVLPQLRRQLDPLQA